MWYNTRNENHIPACWHTGDVSSQVELNYYASVYPFGFRSANVWSAVRSNGTLRASSETKQASSAAPWILRQVRSVQIASYHIFRRTARVLHRLLARQLLRVWCIVPRDGSLDSDNVSKLSGRNGNEYVADVYGMQSRQDEQRAATVGARSPLEPQGYPQANRRLLQTRIANQLALVSELQGVLNVSIP